MIMPRVLTLYESIKKELFESKMSASTEIIMDLSRKIEQEMISLQYVLRSIKTVENKYSTINTEFFDNKTMK